MAAASKLTGEQLQLTMGYWSGLGTMLGQNQIELIAAMQSRSQALAAGLENGGDDGAQVASSEPVASALQVLADVARKPLDTRALAAQATRAAKVPEIPTASRPRPTTGKSSSKSFGVRA